MKLSEFSFETLAQFLTYLILIFSFQQQKAISSYTVCGYILSSGLREVERSTTREESGQMNNRRNESPANSPHED